MAYLLESESHNLELYVTKEAVSLLGEGVVECLCDGVTSVRLPAHSLVHDVTWKDQQSFNINTCVS